MNKSKRIIALLLSLAMTLCLFAGCNKKEADKASSEKTFVFGDTTFNAENEEATANPHDTYCGWACIRYGIGETLFKFNDKMELEPWLATDAHIVDGTDNLVWEIILRDGVKFSSGRVMDGAAVQECFQDLIDNHERAAGDLSIVEMANDGQKLWIRTAEPKPTLINYLCDPYGCVIDVQAGVSEDGIPVGTGPYVGKELVTDDHLDLVKNPDYWNGTVNIDKITVRTISDGDTLALALQKGDIDAAYGMAYASYPTFTNDDYQFSSTATSRSFYCQMNYASPVIGDPAVRKAIAMGINKEGFVNTLLDGYGYTATGAFPDTFSYGGNNLTTEKYDAAAAKQLLEEAGWVDTNGDGIREKNGQNLTIRWVTYPSRQELPLLAESAQQTLREIGIDVQINSTADHNTIVADKTQWDVYAAAFVTCGIGDPMYFFTTHCLDDSSKNRGGYHNDQLQVLAEQMNNTFDTNARGDLAVQMQQTILDDNAFVFCSFLRMSMISKSNVKGLTAHACDYYELTAELDIE